MTRGEQARPWEASPVAEAVAVFFSGFISGLTSHVSNFARKGSGSRQGRVTVSSGASLPSAAGDPGGPCGVTQAKGRKHVLETREAEKWQILSSFL